MKTINISYERYGHIFLFDISFQEDPDKDCIMRRHLDFNLEIFGLMLYVHIPLWKIKYKFG